MKIKDRNRIDSKSEYDNFAFISYSHQDMRLAKWLHKRLEHYRLPTEIENEIDAESRYLRPVFRDEADLNSGILQHELDNKLAKSKYLILICSKYSAESKYVSGEAETFVKLGRLDRIIPVVIPEEGVPEVSLFPKYLREYFAEHPNLDLLGINLGKDGRQKMLIRVISKMLELPFDYLWKRHLRERRKKIAIASSLGVVTAASLYLFAVPVTVEVGVNAERTGLPTGECIRLRVNGAEYEMPVYSNRVERIRLAGYNRFKEMSIEVSSQFFNNVDTMMPVGFGVRREVGIPLMRDSSFAVYEGTVSDDNMDPVEGVTVTVCGRTADTDADGKFSITLPIGEQRVEQVITIEKQGFTTITREDEPPGTSLQYILHK